MSKSLITVNFNDLKFNLYEILGLQNDATESKIKKKFKVLVIELHPDKNKDSNDEIFQHVMLANQVLTNPTLRKDYDNFLAEKDKKTSHFELKNNYEASVKDIEKLFPEKDEANKTFKTKIKELNIKHGADTNLNSGNVMNQYENIKKIRNTQVSIPQEKISNTNDFNKKFESRKDNGVFNDQLIVSSENNNLGTYQSQDALANIADYSKLYSEDSVSTGSYTSLDMAFKIQKVNADFQEKSLKERMQEYKNQTNTFKNMKMQEFSNKNFNDWSRN